MKKISTLPFFSILLAILISNVCIAQSWSAKADFGGTARKNAAGFAISNKGYIGTGDDGIRRKDFWEYNQNTNTWTQKLDLPGDARDKASAFTIGTKGYILLGNNGSGYLSDVWEYDPAGNTWTAKAPFPGGARQSATGYSIGTKGYITGGYDGSTQKIDHWEFDPIGNTWTQKANFGGGIREGAVGFGLTNGMGYVGTGWDGSTRKKDWWKYNPGTNTWTQMGDFAGTQRIDATGFAIGSRGYLGIGNDGSVRNDFWEYEPISDTWTQQPDYTGTARGKAVGLGIGSRGYIGTGEDAIGRSKTWHEFKPCDTWERKANFPGTGRAAAFGFAIGNKGYMGTGYDGTTPETKDVWEYNPATDTWTQVADFGGTARHATFSFSIGTKGYVGGGYDGGINNNDFWEYDQPTNTWTIKAAFPGAGRISAMGLAINGKGYAGTGNSGVYHNDWYEYNPATNTWTTKANFPGTARTNTAGFVIGNFGYMGTGNDGTIKKDFYRYNPATDTWSAVADAGVITREAAIGFTLCNKGYLAAGLDASSNLLKEFWEYDPGTNVWNQKIDYGGFPSCFNSAFVIGCNAYVGLGVINLGGGYTNELWEYSSCCCGGGGSGGVGGGGGGGIESQSLGDVIAKRLFNAAIYNTTFTTDYDKAPRFVKNNSTIVNGPNDLNLIDLIPVTVAGTNKAVISTPTDLTQFTNAIEVLSVDYTSNNIAKAVAFATRTQGIIYAHTKPICDRLKGAELLEVIALNVNGYSLVAYKIKQQTGEVEYAANLSAGIKANRNSITLQSNWFTYNYQQDDKLFNFQLWATNYSTIQAMAQEIIGKLQATAPVNLIANSGSDLPKTFISKGSRVGTQLSLSIKNATNFTNGYFDLDEKANEKAISVKRSVPFTIAANGTSTFVLPVSDIYESNIYVYVNNKLVDLVYLSDGAWDIAYNKNNTTISNFSVNNDVSFINTVDEYPLMRNATITGASKDYVSIYKLVKAAGLDANLSAFNGLKFNAITDGISTIKVTLTKKSVANWSDQYSIRIPVNYKGEYKIAFADLRTLNGGKNFNPNDVLIADFSFERSNNQLANINASVSKTRFVKDAVSMTPPIVAVKQMAIYPNPNKGKFTISFTSDEDMSVVLKVVEIATGKLVKTNFITAKKGVNNLAIEMQGLGNPQLYNITLEADGVKYEGKRVMISKN